MEYKSMVLAIKAFQKTNLRRHLFPDLMLIGFLFEEKLI